MPDNPRTIKNSPPAPLVIKAVALGALALGVILFSIWQFGSSISSAKMTGTIVAKEYRPFAASENQITLNRDGSVRSDQVDGEYLITVEVPQAGGEKKTFTVWLNSKERYDAVQIGDSFDVGPYVVTDQPAK